jgi:hypothetical protein
VNQDRAGRAFEGTDRVVIVGESNPYGASPEFALHCWPTSCAGHRLRRILGVAEERYLAFRRLNLCEGPWRRRDATRSASRLYDELPLYTGSPRVLVLLLGVQVSAAFSAFTVASRAGIARPRALDRWEVGSDALDRARWLSIPHPSGLCRVWGAGMWSAGGAVQRTRDLLRQIAPHVPWGEDVTSGITP